MEQTAMLDFRTCFDAEKDIVSLLNQEQSSGEDAGTGTGVPRQVRVLGQERDGAVLYTWSDISPYRQDDVVVSHIGLYEPISKVNTVLFVHEKLVNLVNCTVNQERTLLAFTTQEKATSSSGSPSWHSEGRQHAQVYRSYLAEVQPANRVFYLNIERDNYLMVQFLHGKGHGDATSKESHMLFLIHKELIGLYHMKLSRVGYSGVEMCGQPRTEVLAKRFQWAQWDHQRQRLYYLSQKKKNSNSKLTFTCMQFYEKYPPEIMMEVQLPIYLPPEVSKAPSIYEHLPLSNKVTDQKLLCDVLTLPGGSLCICYQHPIMSPEDHHAQEEDIGEYDVVDIEYSVFMLHRGTVLHCCMPGFARLEAVNIRLHFFPINDYILVFSPGQLLHLLNVAAEFEPCHHIVWHVVSAATNVNGGHGVPNLPSPSTDGRSLTTFLRERAGLCVYDCRQDIAYRVSVSKEGFADVFAGCYLPSTRLAIMHYAAVHHKDSSLAKLLVGKMCNDIGSPEVSGLLTEFLVGTTYNAMRRQLDMRILPLLQFTSTETGRGQLEKNEKGQQLARITYSSLRDIVQMKYSKVDKTQSDGSFWEHLRYNLQKLSIADMWPRFNTTSLQQHITAANQEAAFADDLVEGRVRSSSLLKRISDSARRAFSGSSTPRKGSLGSYAVLTFLNAAERDLEQDRVVGMTVEQLTDHLSRHLPRETRVKVFNVAREFVSCQLQQSKQLLQFIWTSLGFQPDGDLASNVGEPGSQAESELFHMTERFYMAAQELCFPLPNGFKTFFTTLGFRCLDSHVFLQYVDRGVLHLTDDFRDMVMEDLGDDRDNSEMKLNIVSRLPKALTGLQQWNHPISTRFLSKQYVSSLLLEGEDLGWASQPRRVSLTDSYSTSSSQDSSEDDSVDAHVHFPPLATLMKLLQMKEPHTRRHSRSGRYVDLKFVQQSALQQTKQEYGTNLSNVSF
ncbi:gamma-secretase-activating protein-like isoform X2 [Branchiostoma floridae]|uniref:Gamma-secretase-activating protein-like isoform X2 n=1 Tax=Branchiostoma floridae TaxID=7739 RepID=A0A9J7MQV1_BRAFL|nr:gamma-secretase-activating protein-like isoform X2 [Branchiostoma floridae]